MPNKRSALKAHRVGERRLARNRPVRSALRTYVKKARASLHSVVLEEAAALVAEAAKHLDEAASKGIIHKNQAARRKGRLMHQLAIAGLVPTAPAEAPRTRAGRGRSAGATPRATRATRPPGSTQRTATTARRTRTTPLPDSK